MPHRHAASWPDQAKASKLIHADVGDTLTVWHIHTWCMEHKLHLIVKKQLRLLGTWYWSTLAKLIHCWRNHMKKMFDSWHRRFGPDRAAQCALQVPPRPTNGLHA